MVASWMTFEESRSYGLHSLLHRVLGVDAPYTPVKNRR